MKYPLSFLVFACALPALTACDTTPLLPNLPTVGDLPIIHKIDVQQGNVVTQEMVAQLVPGMEKRKVSFIMGTPIISDTFHAERWDYIYLYHEGGGGTERRRVTLLFDERELLKRVEGDIEPAPGRLVVDTRQDTTVDVPGEYKPGLFATIKDSIPFMGDDKTAGDEKKAAKADEPADDDEKTTATVPAEPPEDEQDKPGLLRRVLGSVGLAAGDDEVEDTPDETASEDRGYRDPIDPDTF